VEPVTSEGRFRTVSLTGFAVEVAMRETCYS